jgi:aerobic carbon-monoxide dehydrogenase medium subunit
VISPFELKRPTRIEEALDDLAAGGTPYCGGTELLAAMNMGLLAPEMLIDLKRISVLSGLVDRGSSISIGATTRHRSVARDPLTAAHAPVLVAACSQLGNQRVRATGSVAGNLCFAEPRSDVMTTLVGLGADVVLRSVRGERVLALDDFVIGAMDTERADDELLVEIRVPKTTPRQVYVRFQPAEYPTVCVGIIETTSGTTPLRVVVGAVGERPQFVDFAGIDAIDAEGMAADLEITEDLNGADDYKRHVTAVFIRRATTAWRLHADV